MSQITSQNTVSSVQKKCNHQILTPSSPVYRSHCCNDYSITFSIKNNNKPRIFTNEELLRITSDFTNTTETHMEQTNPDQYQIKIKIKHSPWKNMDNWNSVNIAY
eukprot:116335_1